VISVVMCAYNAERYIASAVESILAQTFSDFELLVVDDGSTDGTMTILRAYAARDGRVRVIEAAHQGISAAANRGVAEARRRWIARMDADDIALPNRLERQLAAAAAEPGVVLWGAYALHVNASGKVLGLSRTGPTTVAQFHALWSRGEDGYVLQPTWLVRKDVLVAAGGYDPRFECSEDLELLDRIAEFGPALTIPEPLVLYRVHAASVSMTRFVRMRYLARYVGERRRARLTGRSLTLDEFNQACRLQPAIARVASALCTASAFSYRRAGLSFAGGGRLAATMWFAAAAALNPSYAVPRLWSQVLSASARRLRAAAQVPLVAPAAGHQGAD
jgi:glycosyltransferase involved in cell wall biosynthesis